MDMMSGICFKHLSQEDEKKRLWEGMNKWSKQKW
jgi:hypothetical protein